MGRVAEALVVAEEVAVGHITAPLERAAAVMVVVVVVAGRLVLECQLLLAAVAAPVTVS